MNAVVHMASPLPLTGTTVDPQGWLNTFQIVYAIWSYSEDHRTYQFLCEGYNRDFEKHTQEWVI